LKHQMHSSGLPSLREYSNGTLFAITLPSIIDLKSNGFVHNLSKQSPTAPASLPDKTVGNEIDNAK
jgi:hypothetical protein